MKRKNKNKYIYIPPKEEYYNNSCFELEIKDSNIKNAGKGVFTLEFIPNNTFIDEYTGIIMNHVFCGSYFVLIREGLGIDAQTFPRCYMAMINDNIGSLFEHNCKFMICDDKVEIWSIKDIYKGDELYISYGNEYWK